MNYKVNIISTTNRCIAIPFRRYEYPNLMELIVNAYYEEIEECLGRGLCGTCHVKLVNGILKTVKGQTEIETLDKVNDVDDTSWLACQIIR